MTKFKPFIKPIASILIYFFVCFILPGFIIAPENGDRIFYATLFEFLLYLVLFLGLTSVNFFELKDSIVNSKKLSFNDLIVKAFQCFGLIILANLIGSIISMALGGGQSENQTSIDMIVKGDYKILAFLFICILGPISEEILFRFTFFNLFKKLNLKPVYAIVVSSILFGLIHVISAGDFVNVPPYILMGVAIGYMYYKTDNFAVPVLGHIIQNTFSFIIIVSGIA